MENYENDNMIPVAEDEENVVREDEIVDATLIEDGEAELADGEEANESEEETESEEADDDEDFSAVAEMITASRSRYVAEDEDAKVVADEDDEDGVEPEHDNRGSFFDGFSLKKGIVAVVSAALTLAILLSSMVAAVAFTTDKTKRPSDCDMIADEEAEEKARENAGDKENTYAPDEAETQFKVKLDFFDRDDIELYTTKMTLGDIIDKADIELFDGEESTVPLDTMIADETTVPFDKYETVTDIVVEEVPFETERRETDLIWLGETNYIQHGQNGRAEITYSVKLKNGEELSREEIGRNIAEYPQNEIYEIGVGGTVTGADGKTYSYSMRKIVKATYYYIPDDPYTYLGNHPDHTTIAVDMNVIPLGTWLYVKNWKYDFGLRQAQDIGGAVKGDMIDIWLDGSEPGYDKMSVEGIVYDMEVYYVN